MSQYKTTHLEASEMLAEALKQMDGLLSAPTFQAQPETPRTARKEYHECLENGFGEVPPSPKLAPRMHQAKAIRLLDDFKSTLESMEDNRTLWHKVAPDTQHFLCQWLQQSGQGNKAELLGKSTLETHKLDLMAEISNLKLKLASAERDRQEMRESLGQAEKRIGDLQSRLNERTIEVTDLRNKLARVHNGGLPYTASLERSESLKERTFERDRTLDRLRRKHTEMDSLKRAVESLMVSNAEKDKHIDDMKRFMRRYRRIEELIFVAQRDGKKALELLDIPDNVSESSSTQNSAASSSITDPTMREPHTPDSLDGLEPYQKPNMPYPSATSTPVGMQQHVTGRMNGTNPDLSTPSAIVNHHSPSNSLVKSNSAEDLSATLSKTPPSVTRKGQSFAQTEQDEEAMKDRMAQEYKQIQAHNVDAQQKHKKKGIKTFFGKLKRSNSQELDDQAAEFKRGGVRATASGRIGTGWSGAVQYDFEVPFARWDSDRVSTWLHNIGLSMYVGTCKRWVRNGDQLLRASSHDLEKELHMKNPLHRKKLQLALKTMTGEGNKSEHIHRLDHNWVTRWLDDIGLPQYKDVFHDAMVDGRMLHCFSVDDLVYLKVSNALHHYSIKAGIQVLRLHQFDPNCLKRRPLPDEPSPLGAPHEVMLWTNHRVMEWLRSIDLSEYAPNLRGSGVHGGLMVLESYFTAELLASILSIPNNKTLLRRHLSTHFVSLIGNATQQRKRETEQQTGYIPLTPNHKIKVKKGIFGHRRTRSQSEADYLCPLDSQAPPVDSTHTNGTASCNGSQCGTLERRQHGGGSLV